MFPNQVSVFMLPQTYFMITQTPRPEGADSLCLAVTGVCWIIVSHEEPVHYGSCHLPPWVSPSAELSTSTPQSLPQSSVGLDLVM